MILPVIVECHPSSTSGCVLCSACSIGEVSLDNRTSCIECGPGGWSSVFSPAHYLILTCSNRSLPALRGWSQVHAVSSWYSLQVSRTVHVHVLRHYASMLQHSLNVLQQTSSILQHTITADVATLQLCITSLHQCIATLQLCITLLYWCIATPSSYRNRNIMKLLFMIPQSYPLYVLQDLLNVL